MEMTQSNSSMLRPIVFADAMLEPSADHRKKRMVQSAVSLVAHTSAIAVLVILPLLISSQLSLRQLNSTFLLAPAPPPPPAPRVVAVRPEAAPKIALTEAKLTVPTVVPKHIEMAAPDIAAASAIPSTDGILGGTGSVFGAAVTPAPPPPVAAAPAGPKKPFIISGDMKQPVLVYGPTPIYPPIARAGHVSGTVVILAIIDEHGNVVEARAVSGPVLLTQAALHAVTLRKYQPTILDGQPTPIQLHVEVTFNLANS